MTCNTRQKRNIVRTAVRMNLNSNDNILNDKKDAQVSTNDYVKEVYSNSFCCIWKYNFTYKTRYNDGHKPLFPNILYLYELMYFVKSIEKTLVQLFNPHIDDALLIILNLKNVCMYSLK